MYRFEDYELHTETFRLTKSGEQIPVEPQVFDVLAHLVENRHRVVPKEELLDEVWGDRFVSESALTTRIKMARRAVGDDGRTQRLIRNSHGRGYQFVGEVTDSAGSAHDIAALSSDDGSPTEQSTQPSPSADPRVNLMVDEEFPFVGRDEPLEHGRLAARATAVDGRPSALLIGGEPGVGKTRLAAQISRTAAPQLLALSGRCDRYLSESLQPWLEAVGAYVNLADPAQLAADAAGIEQHLRPVFPSLLAVVPETGAGISTIDEYATLDALVVLIERISSHTPLLIVLDDVQWAGGATRSLVSLLLRRNAARVMLALTFRSTIDDLDDLGREWLADLGHHPNVQRIDLGELGTDELSSLLEHAQISGTESEKVQSLSAGHALFATELIRDVRRGISMPHLPDTVAELVRGRLDRLPEEVSRLVSAGAAIGPDFALRLAAAVAGLDQLEALEAVETALEAELVHEVAGSPDQVRFSHQLVPAAILESMSRARRVRLHASLAELLEAERGDPVVIAHHQIEAVAVLDSRQVVDRVRTTAAAALIEHQYDPATTLLERCVELPMDARSRAETLVELGNAYNAAGRQPQALGPFERTAEMGRTNGWPDIVVASALGRWGQSPFRASQDRTVRPLLREALEHEVGLDDSTTARLLAKQAAFDLFTAPLAERDAISGRAESLVGSESTPARLEVLEARWMAIACPATAFDIEPLDTELATLRKELGALTTDACAPEIGLYWRSEGADLWSLAAELESDPRQRRDVDQWRTKTLSATKAIFDGDYRLATQLTDAALPLGREPWGESGRVVHALVHLVIDVLSGAPKASLAVWEEVAATVPSPNMRATRAWVEAVAGDEAIANGLLDDVAADVSSMPGNFMGGFGLVGFAEAALTLGRADLAQPLAAVLEPVADRMLGHPWAPSFAAADLLSRVAEMSGDGDAAAIHRQKALSMYDALGAATFAARLQSVPVD